MNLDTPMLAELYTQQACLERAGYEDSAASYVAFHFSGVMLDGDFTLAELRRIANAYEEWRERSPEAKP